MVKQGYLARVVGVALVVAWCGVASGLEMTKVRREGGSTVTSSTLAWMHVDEGVNPAHAVPVTEDDPATVWCRAKHHGTWLAGQMHARECSVPFLGNVLHVKDDVEVLVSVNGSARVRLVKWDRYMAPPHNAVAAHNHRFLAVQTTAGHPQAGFLAPHDRRAYLVDGARVETVDAALVLVEEQPVRYELRGIVLDQAKLAMSHEDQVLAQALLLNPGPSRQRVVEEREVVVRQLSYWGSVKGTYNGLPTRVHPPPPDHQEKDLVWGIQNEFDHVQRELLEYELPPGTGVRVKLVGSVRKTEAPYFGTLTATFQDDSTGSRVIEGLHMDQRLVLITAQYSPPHYIHNNTVLDVPQRDLVVYSSTTTTTTTTTTSTTTTTPDPPKMSMVGPEKPKSDSLSTTAQREVEVALDNGVAPLAHGLALAVTMALLALMALG